jgi:peptidyl-prolyl cis-trans isomerase C
MRLLSFFRTPYPRCLLAAGFGLLAVVSEGRDTLGAPPPVLTAPGLSPIVARVGSITITAADLERRLAALPPFQLRSLGATPAEIKRTFLDKVMVREALLSQGGADRGLDGRDDVRERTKSVLRSAILNRIKTDVTNSMVSEADVQAYYEKNAAKFHSPARVAVWILATHKKEEAKEILDELHKDASPKHWSELTRTKSIDTATAMRGGNIGFVSPDGTTPEPGIKLSPAVMAAVEKLKDAEITAEPVADGDRFVIVWRKQTMKSVDRPVELEASSIRQMLIHQRVDARIKEIVASLRKDHVHEHNPDLIDLFDISPQGDLTAVRRPGALPSGKRAPVNPVPAPGNLR